MCIDWPALYSSQRDATCPVPQIHNDGSFRPLVEVLYDELNFAPPSQGYKPPTNPAPVVTGADMNGIYKRGDIVATSRYDSSAELTKERGDSTLN